VLILRNESKASLDHDIVCKADISGQNIMSKRKGYMIQSNERDGLDPMVNNGVGLAHLLGTTSDTGNCGGKNWRRRRMAG
jgi:hypothetical protein